MASPKFNNHACTFCYKTLERCEDLLDQNSEKISINFITFILRHLDKYGSSDKIESSSMRKAYKLLKSSTSTDTAFNWALLCKSCKVIAQNFCEFYQKIKELELRLDFEINKIWDVMRYADKNYLHKEPFDKKLPELITTDSVELQNLRKLFIQKVQSYQTQKMTTCSPRIILSRVVLDSTPKPEIVQNFIPRLFSPITLDDSTVSDDNNDELYLGGEKEEQNYDDKEIPLNPISSTSTKVNKGAHIHQKCVSKGNRMESIRKASIKYKLVKKRKTINSASCLVCGKIYRSEDILRKHKFAIHPELFFKGFKLASEDDETFKTYVGFTTEIQVDQQFTRIMFKSGKWKRPKYKCRICSKILFERLVAKTHLLSKHKEIIVEKLDEVRKSDRNFSEIQLTLAKFKLRGTKPKYCPPSVSRNVCNISESNQMECITCHQKFRLRYNLSRHEALKHPEMFFVSVKSELVSEAQFQLLVKHVFSQELEKFRKTKNSSKSGSKYKCSICPTLFSSLKNVRAHVVLVHSDVLANKLEKLQMDLKY